MTLYQDLLRLLQIRATQVLVCSCLHPKLQNHPSFRLGFFLFHREDRVEFAICNCEREVTLCLQREGFGWSAEGVAASIACLRLNLFSPKHNLFCPVQCSVHSAQCTVCNAHQMLTHSLHASFSDGKGLGLHLQSLCAKDTKDEVKRPQGPPTRSWGPEAPWTSGLIYKIHRWTDMEIK